MNTKNETIEKNLKQHNLTRLKVKITIDNVVYKHRDLEIVRMRLGLEGYKPHTLQAIANVFGLSRERIRQIESRVLKHLYFFSEVK